MKNHLEYGNIVVLFKKFEVKKMKTIEKFLLQASAYTVGIMLAFFVLASAFGISAVLSFFNFFICILIGTAITAANLVYKIKALQIWAKTPIHYAILLALFIPFLYIAIPEFMQRPAAIFVAIMIFTIFYAVAVAITVGIIKLVGHLDSKLEKQGKNAKNTTNKNTSNYTPKFK